MVESAEGDVLVATTSAGAPDRRRALEARGIRVLVLNGPGGRVNLRALVEHLGAESYQSLMIEAGSKMNWAVLESGVADKVYFYYAPKILGGLQSLPVAGGAGRRSRKDAIQFRNLTMHAAGGPDEFAVEAYLVKEG
jgi:diaminohydroxyphosphoribosylaminopyrimidine deaminase/5-amino-6-(5-phosphoribosylamino)uracil reductase